ncbi:hypothetical protein ANO11243_062050 [Dothideomycetidae sp. 11243]|nr:hypothetical protein ANO11243_062050 [fungal sp. No.11243]
MADVQDRAFEALGFTKSTSDKGLVSYSRDLDQSNADNANIVLIHGYPQSSYIWRHVIPLLPKVPLYVPDMPGYGQSAPTSADKYGKLALGELILSALRDLLPSGPTVAQPVVIIGHDRGGRVAHHLALAPGNPAIKGFRITAVALLDIVPTLYQWRIGSSAAAQTGYFHWSFLANTALAMRLISAYGGGNWAREMIDRWAGKNAAGRARLASDDAPDVYARFFDKPAVVEASCRDYEAGAKEDAEYEAAAEREGRAIAVPLLLVYSAEFLPKRATIPIEQVWGPPWSERQDLVTSAPIGNGIGHFVAEEAPEEVAKAIRDWLLSIKQ